MSSGSEAVELAMKIARRWGYRVKGIAPNQAKILTISNNYHGKTLAPLSASSFKSFRNDFGPFVPGVGSDVCGFPIRYNHAEDIQKAFEEHGSDICALIIESIQGYAGCIPAEVGYLEAVRELCTKHNVLYVADEIQTGFGRTGYLMAYKAAGIQPDLLVVGKALTGGMYPMSLVLGKDTAMTQIHPGEHSSTFAANPMGSAIAMTAVDVILEEKLPERSRRLGKVLLERLSALQSPAASIRATGRGLFCTLHIDPTESPARVTAERVGTLARQRRLIVVNAENRIRINPPLVIEENDLLKGIEILKSALEDCLTIGELKI
ncbi:ornithine-oxo-acid transaminase, variant [Exophiala oligosperma]|nr:ornithine-oxo-acid transaminase, variant [Exophiala oligosperma]KIW36225.1 ornithine-oxo-acid transaminase, variant [Exophiala oligosperma]